jgi:chromosome segregation ATPase
MRIRTIVSSAALMTALLSTSSLVTEAMAQKGVVSSPTSEWAVTKIDDAGGAYCALARKYTKGTVMTFAQNQSAETSFALDFQRPILTAGANASIILDPGAGEQRTYNVQPFSNQALVVRLGQDDAFFKALDKTGFLRVEVGDQSYQFSIADIQDGRGRLDGCISAMVTPAAGGDEIQKEALLPAPVEEANAKIASMNTQIEELKAENKKLGRSLNNVSAKAPPSPAVSELSEQLEVLGSENQDLRAKLELAKAPTQKIGDGLMRVRPEGARKGADAPAGSEDLVAENLRLKAEIQTLQPKDEVIASLEQTIEDLKQKNSHLESDGAKAKNENMAALNAQLEELSGKNAALEEQIASIETSAGGDDYEAQLANLESQNAALKSNLDKKGIDVELLDQLRQQIGKVENESRLLKETAAQAKSELELQKNAEIEQMRRDNDAEMALLQNSIERLKAENAQKAKDLLMVGQASSELQALQDENKSLHARLDEQAEAMADTAAMKEKIAALEADNVALNDAVKMAKAEAPSLTDTIKALQAENDSLQQNLAEAKSRDEDVQKMKLALEEAQKQVSELQQMAQAEGNSEAEQMASFEQKIVTLEERNAKMKTAINNLVPVVEGYKKQLALKDEERVAQLAAKDAEANAKIAAVNAEVEHKIAAAQIEAEQKIAAKESEFQLQLAAREEEIRLMGDKGEAVAVLEGRVAKMKAALEKLIPVSEAYQQQLAAKDEELKALGEKAQALAMVEEHNMSIESKLSALVPVTENYQAQLAAKEDEIKALAAKSAQMAALQKQSEELVKEREQELASLRKTLEEGQGNFNVSIAAKEEQIASLKKELEGLNAKAGSSDELAQAQIKEIEALKTQIAEARTHQQNASQNAQSHEEKLAAMAEDLKSMAIENRELKNQLALASEAMNAQKQELAALQNKAEAFETAQAEAKAREAEMVARETAELEKMAQAQAAEDAANAMELAAIDEPSETRVKLVPPPPRKPAVMAASIQARDVTQEMMTNPALIEPAAGDEDLTTAQDIIIADASQPKKKPEDDIEVAPLPPSAPESQPAPAALGAEPSMPSQEQLNEAQIQERAVKQNLETQTAKIKEMEAEKARLAQEAKNAAAMKEAQAAAAREEAAAKIAAENKAKVEAPAEPLSMRQSEDPFAKIEVENADGTVVQEAAEPTLENKLDAAAMAEPSQVDLAKPPVASEAIAAAPPPAPVPAAASGSIQDLLASAQISSSVKQVDPEVAGSGKTAYEWQDGFVFGSAEQKPITSDAEFDGMVKEYLDRTQKRCPGEFAVVPDSSSESGQSRTDTYEVACVGNKVSSGASLVFFNKAGVFTAVAHEAPTEQLGQAIDHRDQVVRAIKGS